LIKIKNVAIFGGTFDPIHRGHIYLVEQILDSRRFDQIIVVPAGNPWQRPTIASAADRLAMARLAFTTKEISVSDCEVVRSAPSYAIDTVRELKRDNDASFTWIIGSDALNGLESWHQIQELAALVDFLVIIRPGYSLSGLKVPPFIRWQTLEIGALDISATEIRTALHEHREVSNLITDPVLSYIKEKRLYGAA